MILINIGLGLNMSGKYQQDRATTALWQAKLNALQQALGSNNFFHGTDFRNFNKW